MEKDKRTDAKGCLPTVGQEELCRILSQCHHTYQEDVINGDMTYEDFSADFFGFHNGLEGNKAYNEVFRMFRLHQPIIEYRFRSSSLSMDEAMAMLSEFGHEYSFFDRSLIDIQLKSIIPKLGREGVMPLLTDCANTTAMFYDRVDVSDMMAILTGTSKKDYGIFNVSHFAYFMKKMEKQGMMIQHWQSMIWNLSRIVYRGRYLTQHMISSTVHNIGYLKRRPWQYDEIDDCMANLRNMRGQM